jgi:hypothetical protein
MGARRRGRGRRPQLRQPSATLMRDLRGGTILLFLGAQLAAVDIGDLGSRIYPNDQGQRVPARADFGFAADDSCGVVGGARPPLKRFRRVRRSFYEVEVNPVGGSRSGPSRRTFLEGRARMTGRGVPQPSVGSSEASLPGLSPHPRARGSVCVRHRLTSAPGRARCRGGGDLRWSAPHHQSAAPRLSVRPRSATTRR